MLRIRLTADDLEHVRIASRPAPMLELHALLHDRTPPAPAGVDRARLELVRDVIAQPCAPGFLFPSAVDLDDALETVAGARRETIRRDLEDNVSAGFPLPPWTRDLARPGGRGTAARHALRAALAHVASVYVEPRTRRAAAAVDARTVGWRRGMAARGAAGVLGSLHPSIRLRDSVLSVDLASGAEVQTSAGGAGIRIVPTLSGSPAVTVSGDGDSPLVLTCPVPAPDPPDGRRVPDTLADLMGPSRAMLLTVVGSAPGLGVRELGRRTGLAPASVSEHLQVLRRGGLVDAESQGRRSAHRLSPLGWSLLLYEA